MREGEKEGCAKTVWRSKRKAENRSGTEAGSVQRWRGRLDSVDPTLGAAGLRDFFRQLVIGGLAQRSRRCERSTLGMHAELWGVVYLTPTTSQPSHLIQPHPPPCRPLVLRRNDKEDEEDEEKKLVCRFGWFPTSSITFFTSTADAGVLSEL